MEYAIKKILYIKLLLRKPYINEKFKTNTNFTCFGLCRCVFSGVKASAS